MTNVIVCTLEDGTLDVQYERRDDGWYIWTEGDGWRPFADTAASERMVKQLIRKEYDDRY